MRDPLNRTAQRNVSSNTIVAGDLIYRAAPQGDFMMQVRSVSTDTHEGMDVFVFRGDVFTLRGKGTGTQAYFMGDMTAHLTGTGVWKLPADKMVTKGVMPEEAEWEFPQ